MWLSAKYSRLRFRDTASALLIDSVLVVTLVFGAGCANQPANQSGDKAADTATQGQPAPSSGLLGKVFETTVIVPEGTSIQVTVDETLTSDKSHAGDRFAASLSEPVEVNGKTAIPRGAHVSGRVVGSKESGRLHAPAQLSVTLTSVEVGGKTYPLETRSISRAGKGHGTRNAEFIGGGGAAGALIGGLAGGGKGALIGAAAGAGAGTAGAAVTGKKEISIPAESHLTFRLIRAVTITVKG